MAGIPIQGNSGTVVDADSDRNLFTTSPGYNAAGVIRGGGPENAGSVAMFSENDPGTRTGERYVSSPETDGDAKLRVAHEVILDRETFNYTAQNTGKSQYNNTTMTMAWTANGMQTNSASITTINTGVQYRTRAFFPVPGASSLYCEFVLAPSVDPVPSNTTVDVGFFITADTNPFAPTDGAYFRFNSGGVFGVICAGSSETLTGALSLPGGLVATERVKYTISVTKRKVDYWAEVDGTIYLLGSNPCPASRGAVFTAAALPFAVRHAIGGTAAGAAFSVFVTHYLVSLGGMQFSDSLAQIGNRSLGSYQGLSGGTMGSLAIFANNTNPTPAAGSNTAANTTGLGGHGAINAAVAAVTDLIMANYTVPAGTAAVQGRRLRVSGVTISLVNMGAAVATTLTTLGLTLAFGHTAVSLATAEAATTKAPRRIPLGIRSWPVGAAIGAGPTEGDINVRFENPVYVNPGENITTTMKFLAGTATASQAIWYYVAFDYGWE